MNEKVKREKVWPCEAGRSIQKMGLGRGHSCQLVCGEMERVDYIPNVVVSRTVCFLLDEGFGRRDRNVPSRFVDPVFHSASRLNIVVNEHI